MWRVQLTDVEDDLTRVLSEDERARAAQFLGERDRRLWARSRGVLRELLARYLRLDPGHIRLSTDQHGKPSLTPREHDAQPPAFNLSHSGALALYAFSRAGSVGVDVESTRSGIDEAAIAARLLGADEAERLGAISEPAQRHIEFLRSWTRHEALVKCLGTGIAAAHVHDEAQRLWTRALELDDDTDATAALACEHEPRMLRLWSWRA